MGPARARIFALRLVGPKYRVLTDHCKGNAFYLIHKINCYLCFWNRQKIIKTLGNILWLILGGIVIALIYYVIGLLMCITIVGIPWGLQHFKMAIGSLLPFGKTIK